MAKVRGPMLSLDARGTVGKTLTYKNNRGTQDVRGYKRPSMPPDPRTSKQLFHRDYFRDIVSIWHAGSAALRDFYRERAARQNLTGYNLFISTYTLERPSQVGNIRMGHSKLRYLTQ